MHTSTYPMSFALTCGSPLPSSSGIASHLERRIDALESRQQHSSIHGRAASQRDPATVLSESSSFPAPPHQSVVHSLPDAHADHATQLTPTSRGCPQAVTSHDLPSHTGTLRPESADRISEGRQRESPQRKDTPLTPGGGSAGGIARIAKEAQKTPRGNDFHAAHHIHSHRGHAMGGLRERYQGGAGTPGGAPCRVEDGEGAQQTPRDDVLHDVTHAHTDTTLRLLAAEAEITELRSAISAQVSGRGYAYLADKAHRLQEREQSLTNWEQRLTVREAQLLERAWCPSCSAGVEGRDMSRTDDVEPTYPTRSPQDLKSVHFLFPTTESPRDTVNRPHTAGHTSPRESPQDTPLTPGGGSAGDRLSTDVQKTPRDASFHTTHPHTHDAHSHAMGAGLRRDRYSTPGGTPGRVDDKEGEDAKMTRDCGTDMTEICIVPDPVEEYLTATFDHLRTAFRAADQPPTGRITSTAFRRALRTTAHFRTHFPNLPYLLYLAESTGAGGLSLADCKALLRRTLQRTTPHCGE